MTPTRPCFYYQCAGAWHTSECEEMRNRLAYLGEPTWFVKFLRRLFGRAT